MEVCNAMIIRANDNGPFIVQLKQFCSTTTEYHWLVNLLVMYSRLMFFFFHSAMDVDPVLPRITTPERGDVDPDHIQTEEDSAIPSSVPVSSVQSSANIPSVKGDLHNYHHIFYIPTITMRILKYVDPEDLPKISQALPAVFYVLEKCFDWSNILVNMTYQDTEDYLQMAKLKHKFKKLSLEGDCRCLLADIRKFLNCNTATLESVL